MTRVVDQGVAQALTVCGIIAFYNEAENLDPLIKELNRVFSRRPEHLRLVLVDDGSRDTSYEVARALQSKYPDISIIRFSRNFGHHSALLAGIKYARGDLFFLMDADFQDDPQTVPQLIDARPPDKEIIYAVRTGRVESFKRRLAASIYWSLVNLLTEHRCEPNQAVLRVFTRPVMDALAEVNDFKPFLAGLFAWTGFPHATLELPHRPRLHGTSKYSLLKLIGSTSISLLSFTHRPLRLVTYFGLAISAMSLAIGIGLVISYLAFGAFAQGWTSIFVAVLFSLGVQLGALGLVGEYVGRIFHHTGGRPPYVIRDISDGGELGGS